MKEKIKNINIKSKTIINIIIIFLLILLVVISNNQLNNNNLKKITKQRNQEEMPLISFIPYDNQDEESIKGLIIVDNLDSIDYVEFFDSVKIYGNEKNRLARDVQLEKNKEYNVKIFSNGTENIQKIKLDDSYLETMISFKEVDVAEGENKKIEIKDNRGIEGVQTFYKIGRNTSSNWIPYTKEIELDESCIDIEDYANRNYESTIYTINIDKAGNIFYINKTFNITKKGELDIFRNVLVSGTLEQYGFTSAFVNCGYERGWSAFEIGKIGAGRAIGHSSYSGTFKLHWSKLKKLKAKELSIGSYQYSERWDSWVETTITVFYTDGTTDVKQIPRLNSGLKNYNTTFLLQKEKEIDYLQFYINRI